MYHNEALALIDLLIAGVLEAGPIAAPPASPAIGGIYLIAASGATGAFAGMEARLAGWTAGGWRFVAPVEGIRLTLKSSGVDFHYWNGAWRSGSLRADELVIGGVRVVGSAAAAIPDPAGGTGADAKCAHLPGADPDGVARPRADPELTRCAAPLVALVKVAKGLRCARRW